MSKLYIVADEKLEENINPEQEASEQEETSEENLAEKEAIPEENSEQETPKETQEEKPEPETPEETQEEKPEPETPEENPEQESPEVDFKEKTLNKAREVLPKILAQARKLFSIKVTHVLYVLGALIFCLFLFLLLESKGVEEEKRLIGYIRIHHRIPEWFHGEELPHEAIQHLENHKAKLEKIKQKYIVIPDDRNAKNRVLGGIDDPPLDNQKLLAILHTQDLGRITDASVEKPENMNLSGYDLSQLDYKYFREFIGADLRYANFDDIEEEGLSFRGSSLSHTQFADALIPHTNFIRTHISFANFFESVLDSSSFIGVNGKKVHFNRARMVEVNFKEAKIMDSDFSETTLDKANFKNTYLAGNSFNNSHIEKANFKNSQLQGSSFVNCDLRGTDFTNANLEGVDFTGADLAGVKFTDADITQAKFAGTKNVTLAQLSEVRFLLSASSIPPEIIPKKQSWLERFRAPHDPSNKK